MIQRCDGCLHSRNWFSRGRIGEDGKGIRTSGVESPCLSRADSVPSWTNLDGDVWKSEGGVGVAFGTLTINWHELTTPFTLLRRLK